MRVMTDFWRRPKGSLWAKLSLGNSRLADRVGFDTWAGQPLGSGNCLPVKPKSPEMALKLQPLQTSARRRVGRSVTGTGRSW